MSITELSDLHSIKQIGTNAVGVAFKSTPILAIPGLTEDVTDRIADAGGEKVTYTVWDTALTQNAASITQDSIVNSRTGVTPSKLSLTSYDETAISKTISIDIDKFAMDDSSEDVQAHLSQLVGKEFSRVIQDSLITNGVGSDKSVDITGETDKKMSVAAIVRARLAWGEHASEIGNPTLFLTTVQFADLVKDSDFKNLSTGGSNTPVKANEDWSKYVIASVYGVNIVLCDSLPNTGGATPKYTSLLIGEGAFGLHIGNVPETDKVISQGSRIHTLDTHFRFSTTLFRHAPKRVVKLITN